MTRLESAGHIRTISAATLNTMDACPPVSGTAVHLGSFLAISAGKQQSHRSGKFGFTLLFRNLNVCRVELPITVWLEDTENVPDDLLLPVDELEGLPCPCAFGVAQAFDEHDGIIRCVHIVVGGFLHELCGLICFQFSRRDHLQGIKKFGIYERKSLATQSLFEVVGLLRAMAAVNGGDDPLLLIRLYTNGIKCLPCAAVRADEGLVVQLWIKPQARNKPFRTVGRFESALH